MEHYLVITAVGTDRPGISDAITHHVTQCGCNIIDSRIALFGTEFTLIMLLSGNNNAISRIESTLPLTAQEHDLITVMKRTSKHQQRFISYTAEFHIEATDAPGLLKHFTHFMASRHIDISALSANTVESTTHGVDHQLILQISTNLPEDCNLMTIQEEFEHLCQQLAAIGSVNFIGHKTP